MELETHCCFSLDFTSFPIAAWSGWLCSSSSGLGKEGPELLVPGTVTPHLRSTWLPVTSVWLGCSASAEQELLETLKAPSWAHGTSDGSERRGKTFVWSVLFLQGWMCEGWCFGKVLSGFPGSQKCKGRAAVGRRWLAHLFPGVSWASLG